MEKFALELDLPEGIVNVSFEKKEEPRRVADIVLDLLTFPDIVVDLGITIAKQFNKPITCKMGCGVCCCQMVPLSPAEAVIITEVIEGLPMKRKTAVLNALADADKKLQDAGIKEKIGEVYKMSISKDVVTDINSRYFDLQIPCPFLVQGSCSIYAWRPSRCREYNVLSPAELCANPFVNKIKRLPITLKFCESLSHAWASLTNTQPVIIPLILAMEWVQNNGEARTLAIEGTESFIRTVLNHASKRANEEALERMKDHT
jgi:Fe-S-cluster containining protein